MQASVLTHEVSVVTCEYDYGVIQLSFFFKGLNDHPYPIVNRSDRAQFIWYAWMQGGFASGLSPLF